MSAIAIPHNCIAVMSAIAIPHNCIAVMSAIAITLNCIAGMLAKVIPNKNMSLQVCRREQRFVGMYVKKRLSIFHYKLPSPDA